ncbi:glutathione S-transferase family protein [Frateuria soli]|uniref:glutathione S-transferase family protein n=1 Tax=Frateuria soli TaxID=1542730 RepID=UPI001E358C34|nr:glutathione S-transferase family protein [Frateuria soli]UGB38070.1 glutathione S-transferase family protein [Frateuria soli]
MNSSKVTFFHAPQSRSRGTLALFEELGVDYDLHLLDLKAGTQRDPGYLALNPLGKVPAIRHEGAMVTEQPAVMMYLADLYPQKGLAPAIGDPLRGPYLRWMVFYGSCFEPALLDRSLQREPAAHMMSPYGTWQEVLDAIVAQLTPGPWLLGERFTAADTLWGTALHWTTMFKLVPELPPIRAYIDRVRARPAMQRAEAKDAGFLARQS